MSKFLSLALLLIATGVAPADEKLRGIACRSVHLVYPAPKGTEFTVEMTVKQSAPGTYFMACGWDKGYFGVQEQGRGKKVVIFSVWDSASNDPKSAKPEDRVKVLHKDAAVRVGRFGGEGSGGQSFLDFDWKLDTPYRFLVKSRVDGKRTEYAGYLKSPDTPWRHLITFSTVTGGRDLGGYYSFVEDFKRDKVSTTFARRATYGDAWVKPVGKDWQPVTAARFSADANPVTNIDAGAVGDRFFLVTGGDTTNAGTKLRETITLPEEKRMVPADLPK
jgi:hypothetical protein